MIASADGKGQGSEPPKLNLFPLESDPHTLAFIHIRILRESVQCVAPWNFRLLLLHAPAPFFCLFYRARFFSSYDQTATL